MRREAEELVAQANYYLETAEELMKLKRFAIVAFLAHQAVEMILKAYHITKKKELPPRTHSLIELGKSVRLDKNKELWKRLLTLNPHYMQSRYPDAANAIPYELYDEEMAKKLLTYSKEVVSELKGVMDEGR